MIKKLREKKGLTQSKLARKIRLSESHVSRMERKVKGYRASYSTIKLLAKYLDECPVKIFVFFAEIDCKHFKETSELKNTTKCVNNCKFEKVKNVSMINKTNENRHLKRENLKLKRQLKIKRRLKRNISLISLSTPIMLAFYTLASQQY